MFKKYGGHKRGRDEVIFINAEKRKDKGMCGERERERERDTKIAMADQKKLPSDRLMRSFYFIYLFSFGIEGACYS